MAGSADATLITYDWLAGYITGEADWPFAVRVLRQSMMKAMALVDQEQIDKVHAKPRLTGITGWDAVLAGAATMTGRGRVSDPAILRWCRDADRYCEDWFDPLDSGKYVWLEYLRTPIELRERNVVLAAGNLKGL